MEFHYLIIEMVLRGTIIITGYAEDRETHPAPVARQPTANGPAMLFQLKWTDLIAIKRIQLWEITTIIKIQVLLT